MSNILKKVLIGSFIGTMFAMLVSSAYFYRFFKKVTRRLDNDIDSWEDIKKF